MQISDMDQVKSHFAESRLKTNEMIDEICQKRSSYTQNGAYLRLFMICFKRMNMKNITEMSHSLTKDDTAERIRT